MKKGFLDARPTLIWVLPKNPRQTDRQNRTPKFCLRKFKVRGGQEERDNLQTAQQNEEEVRIFVLKAVVVVTTARAKTNSPKKNQDNNTPNPTKTEKQKKEKQETNKEKGKTKPNQINKKQTQQPAKEQFKVEQVKCKKEKITTEDAALGRSKPVRSSMVVCEESKPQAPWQGSNKTAQNWKTHTRQNSPLKNKRTEGSKNKSSLLESSDNSQRTGGSH
jgi:hypothetical protein